MRHIWFVAVLAVVGCKSKDKSSGGAGTGSAPAPPVVADAAAVEVDAAAGPGAAAAPLVFDDKGLGPIAVAVTDDSDDGIKSQLEAALAGHPELSVAFEVMETAEGEEGYFAIKKGETEVAQVMRPSFTGGKDLEIHALDPMFSTKDGIKPGDRASALDKFPDLACVAKVDNRLGLLTCTSAAAPKIVYVIDAENWKTKPSKKGDPVTLEKIADRPIFEIVR